MASFVCRWLLSLCVPPLALMAFAISATPTFAAEEAAAVAVLPFAQTHARTEDEYLRAALAETLTAALARASGLQAIERSQVRRALEELKVAANEPVEPATAARVGKAVGAQRVVVGSFTRAGATMRVTCRIVDVPTSTADERRTVVVTRELPKEDAIFALLDEVAAEVVKAMGVETTAQQRDLILQVTQATAKVDAYQHYAQAREQYLSYTPAGFAQAVALFEKATRADDRYALAWAGLAEALVVVGFQKEFSGDDGRAEYRRALDAARKACALAPRLCEAHRALAVAYYRAGEEGDSEADRRQRCEKAARKAIELNPRDAEAHFLLWIGVGAPVAGPGFEHIQKALELNPRLGIAHGDLALRYHQAGRMDDAMRHYRKALEINPRSAMVLSNMGLAYDTAGDLDQAIRTYRRALEIDAKLPVVHTNLGNSYLKQRDLDEAERCYRKALELSPRFAAAHFGMAMVHDARGNRAEAVASLRKFVEHGRSNPALKEMVQKAEQLLALIGQGDEEE